MRFKVFLSFLFFMKIPDFPEKAGKRRFGPVCAGLGPFGPENAQKGRKTPKRAGKRPKRDFSINKMAFNNSKDRVDQKN